MMRLLLLPLEIFFFFEKCQLIRVNGRTAHGDECKYLSFSCFSVYKNFHLAPNNYHCFPSKERTNNGWCRQQPAGNNVLRLLVRLEASQQEGAAREARRRAAAAAATTAASQASKQQPIRWNVVWY
jgi:hypothetical protein